MSSARRMRFCVLSLLVLAPGLAFGAGRERAPDNAPAGHADVGHSQVRRVARPAVGARALASRTTWDSVFTEDQATRGETAYVKLCARCHQAALGGADEAPALTGSAFLSGWNGQTLAELHERVRTTMPTDTPGVYARREVSDVIAYVLHFNHFPSGARELPVADAELRDIEFVSNRP